MNGEPRTGPERPLAGTETASPGSPVLAATLALSGSSTAVSHATGAVAVIPGAGLSATVTVVPAPVVIVTMNIGR